MAALGALGFVGARAGANMIAINPISVTTTTTTSTVPIINPIGIINLPPACPTATVAWCQNPANQSSSCWSTNNDACVQVLTNAYQSSYQNLTSQNGTVSLLLPDQMSRGDTFASGAHVAYDQGHVSMIDNEYNFQSIVGVRRFLTPLFGHFNVSGAKAVTAPVHPEWEADGQAVNDATYPCAEYAYKKYYDYNRFEDAAASCKQDWICIYNAAMTTDPGNNYYGLTHNPLQKRNGKPMTVQIHPSLLLPMTVPKNAWWDGGSSATIGEFYDVLAYKNRYDVSSGIGQNSLVAKPYTYTDRFAWHQQVHDSQQSLNMTLAEYNDIEQRTAALKELLDDYRAVKAELLSLGNSEAVFNILHPHMIASTGCAVPPMIDPITGEPKPCTKPIRVNTPPPYYTVGLPGEMQYDVDHIVAMLISEWEHKSIKDGTTVDHGCLDASTSRCDWTPHQFANEYTNLFKNERENDFNYCVKTTWEKFNEQNYPPMYSYNHGDTDLVDNWMSYAVAQRGPLLAKIPWTKHTGTSQVGSWTDGSNSLGDKSIIAASYHYWGGYDLAFSQNNGNVCGVQGHVGGGLRADLSGIWPIGDDYILVDAEFDGRAGSNGDPNAYASGGLTLFNTSLYSFGGGTAANNFNLVPADPSSLSKGLGYDVYIPVAGVVPVHIHADLSFSAGIGSKVSGFAPQNCDGSGNASLMSINASMTPSVSANANLSAGVGISLAGFGVEAGIRGTLQLLTASAPLNANISVNWSNATDGTNRISLIFNTNGSINLSALSGQIDAYATLAFWTVEQEIYSWSGINLGSIPLYNLTQTFPLDLVFHAPPGLGT